MLDKSLEAKIVELQAKGSHSFICFPSLSFLLHPCTLSLNCCPADQLKEFKRQLEKESSLRMEDATKELNNVKLEVESKKHTLDQRQRQVESVVAEVPSTDQFFSQFEVVFWATSF